MRCKMGMAIGVVALAAALASQANAATIDFSFTNVVSGATPTGTSPWVDVTVSDTSTTGTVQLTVSTDLTSGSPPETLTGIWLNIPSVQSTVGALTIGAGTGTGVVPTSFTAASNPSTFSATQSITPLVGSTTGFYNIYLKFPNSGTTSSFQGVESETFSISGTGLNASDFNALAARTAGGLPVADFYALAALTNSGGTSGSGISYISPAPVPLPAALPLLLGGLGMFGFARRRAANG
jgi:hypothetical protein